jgi:hypothetical protein
MPTNVSLSPIVDFSNVTAGSTENYDGHNVVAEMREIFMENAQMMQTGIEADLQKIHDEDAVSESAKELADDIQNALTAAGSGGKVTINATQWAELQSFAEQNNVNIDGEDFDTWMTSKKYNGGGNVTLSSQDAGDLVAGMNQSSQSASDASQQIMTSLQMLYNYLNADYTSTTSAVKDGTDLLSSIGRNL